MHVVATLSADIVGEETTKIVSGCASFCTKSDHEDVGYIYDHHEASYTAYVLHWLIGLLQGVPRF